LKSLFFYAIKYQNSGISQFIFYFNKRRRIMKKKITILSCLFLLLFTFAEFSHSQTGSLEKIVVSKGPTALEVTIILSGYTYHRNFELASPGRLVIDFIDITGIKAPRSTRVRDFGIVSIRTGRFKANIARVVFDFIEAITPYKLEPNPRGVTLTFWKEKPPPVEKERIIPDRIEIEPKDAMCDIEVMPAKANPNDPITVDMSGSQNSKSMTVEVFNPDGVKIATQELTPDSPKWETKFDQPGEYVFRGKAFNLKQKPSENLCEAKIYINYPPVAILVCSPLKDDIGKPITLNASDSTDPDGDVVKVDFTLVDNSGNLIDKFTDTKMPFSWQRAFGQAGTFAATAVVTDDFGAVSEPARAQFQINPKKVSKFGFNIDIGAMFAQDLGKFRPFAVGRIGLVYKIIPGTLDFTLSGGGGYAPKPNFSFGIVDTMFDFHIGPAFLGLGWGITTKYKDTLATNYGEAVAHIGVDVLKKFSIYVEGRGPVNKETQKHYRLTLGFRYKY
jgi:hypothetical protein